MNQQVVRDRCEEEEDEGGVANWEEEEEVVERDEAKNYVSHSIGWKSAGARSWAGDPDERRIPPLGEEEAATGVVSIRAANCPPLASS